MAESDWKILDYNYDDDDDDEWSSDDYDGDYDYDYRYSSNRRSDESAQFSRLHYSIMSATADIPKLGVHTDFKPIEVVYNEMFQGPQTRSSVKSPRFIPFESSNKVQMTTSTTEVPFLPTPSSTTTIYNQNRHRQSTFSKRFLRNDQPLKAVASRSSDEILKDFSFSKVRRRKKSLVAPTVHSGENILHAFVQNEIHQN